MGAQPGTRRVTGSRCDAELRYGTDKRNRAQAVVRYVDHVAPGDDMRIAQDGWHVVDGRGRDASVEQQLEGAVSWLIGHPAGHHLVQLVAMGQSTLGAPEAAHHVSAVLSEQRQD